MAELLIDAKVTGLNEVKQLDKAVDDLEVTTKKSNASFAKFGNILATGAITALTAMAAAGVDAINKMRELDGDVRNLTVSTSDLGTAFSAFSANLLQQSRIYDGINAAVELLAADFTKLNVALGGNTLELSKSEQKAGELASRILKLTELHGKDSDIVKDLTTQYQNLNKKIVDNYEITVKGISAKDKLVKKQVEEADAVKKVNDEYEIANKQADDYVDAMYKEAEEREKRIKKIDTEEYSMQQLTSATYAQIAALKALSSAMADIGDTSGLSPNEIARRQDPDGAYQRNRSTSEQDRLLRDIAESSRDTNDAIRGY